MQDAQDLEVLLSERYVRDVITMKYHYSMHRCVNSVKQSDF